MNNNETCLHGGVSPINLLANLHDSQAGSGRHRCPTCAYEYGFTLGSSSKWNSYDSFCESLSELETCKEGSIAPTSVLKNLGENQGGTGRHKCTNCAFKQGFEVGLMGLSSNEINLLMVSLPNHSKSQKKQRMFSPSTISFVEREIENKHLGNLGELFVLNYEINYLNKKGKANLAAKVKHVSVEVGDGLGYDILSFDALGNEKRIEVKTTRGDISRDFFLTRNELDVSVANADSYYLYRLFDFDSKLNKAKCYLLYGDLNKSLNLEPIVYAASPNAK